MSSFTYDLTLAGLSVGSAAALTGIGLIVTYRATGVLNFAHGAVAMVCAYVLRQCVVGWGWPLWLGAVMTLLFMAPGIGVVLERFVFRPLSVLGGDPAQTLVASIGVFVLLVGGATLVWGQGARDDAPELVSADPWGQLAVVLVLATGVGAVIRWTRFGRELRAVVDDRQLAVLGGVDVDRVAAAGWAFGSFTAGLTGVLLAPYVRLDPYGLPLLVMEVVAVAVAARMRSLPVAVVVALGIGVGQSQLTRLHLPGWGGELVQAAGVNLFVIALLVAALVLPGLGSRDALPRTATARVATPPGAWIVAGVLFLLPLGFAGSDLHTSIQVPALGVVLLSLVVVTGRGGQLSLGQAAYAGLGALFTALLAAGRFPLLPRLPELAALAVAVLLVAPLGLLTGWPAISRHGLSLALATFAVGVGVSRFVFAQPYATSGLSLARPSGFDGDRAYYVLELALLATALLATHALRRGRTGRALAALRDHEQGASAAGVQVPSLKLLAFVSGAALAALGGGMLAMGLRAFDPSAYDPVRSLLWFAAVIVLGADSTLGALAAAALLVGLDAGARGGVAAALIGVSAVCVGRFPGGPYEALRVGAGRLRARRKVRLTALGVGVRRRLRVAGVPVLADSTAAAHADVARRAERDARRASGPRDPREHASGPGQRGETGTTAAARADVARRAKPGTGQASAARDPQGRTPGTGQRGETGTTAAARADVARRAKPGTGQASAARDPQGRTPGTGQRGEAATTAAARADVARRAERDAERSSGARDPRGRTPGTGQQGEAGATAVTRKGVAHPVGSDAGWDQNTGPGQQGGANATAATRTGVAHPAESAPGKPRAADPGRQHDAVEPSHRDAAPTPPATDPTSLRARPHTAPARTLPTPPLLTAHTLHARYGGFAALDGVDLVVRAGQVTAVVGPNGAGKSTLFHCLAGTVRPARGQVRLGGRDITRLAAHARTRLGVARSFQQLAVFPSLTVAENVRVGAEQGRVAEPGSVERALRLFGLDGDVRSLPAADLPTGILRRVELARAFAGGPRVLLLDEPAAGLDTAEVAALALVLRALAAEGTALLVVEHDLDLVAGLADVVHVMAAGRIVSSGPPGHVLDPPDTREAPA
ncbi:ATP-binding cassette domain-containing protein [Streptomyces sp. NPDC051665]|uniref:ABC transporter permease subunit n=1 Tax=Streptomyces sp. NPDC051665 TaxID=3154647 RepID=UPI0034402A22